VAEAGGGAEERFLYCLSSKPRGTQKKNDGPWGGWLVPRRPKKYQGWSVFL
jgi:hypothetical protein